MGNILLRALPLLVLAAACATTENSTLSDARGPSDGRTIYEGSCGRCHALYMPRSFTAPEWKFYVRKYGRKARLSKAQKALVYEYLSQNARLLAPQPGGA